MRRARLLVVALILAGCGAERPAVRVDPLVRHGSFAVPPPAGWAVVEEPLTGFDELAVASFRVPRGRIDAAFDSLVVRE